MNGFLSHSRTGIPSLRCEWQMAMSFIVTEPRFLLGSQARRKQHWLSALMAARLLVANAGLDAVAVFQLNAGEKGVSEPDSPIGFIPTEWYPTALAIHG